MISEKRGEGGQGISPHLVNTKVRPGWKVVKNYLIQRLITSYDITNYTFSDIDESESDYSQIEEVTAGISSLSQTLQKKRGPPTVDLILILNCATY